MELPKPCLGVSKKATTVAFLMFALVVGAQGGAAVGGSPYGFTTYGGRSYGVGIETQYGGTYFGDTGSLPSDGGVQFADFTPVDTDVADADVLLSYTRGFNDLALSEPATSSVRLLEGAAFEVGADFVYSRSEAVCTGVSGWSEILDLTIGGVAFWVSGAPNQVVYSIPGVFTLTANEQIDSSFGATKAITVNALHAWTPGLDVIVSSASSSVTCGGGFLSSGSKVTSGGLVGTRGTLRAGDLPVILHVPPADFTTGGGHFEPPNSNRPGNVNFGFNAGPRPGQPTETKGNLNLIDHFDKHHLKGDVTDYFQFGDPQDVCRRFAGPAIFDGVPGYRFDAVVCDYGEPGRDDRFTVEVRLAFAQPGSDPVYKVDNMRTTSPCASNEPFCGELDGGNIQLHRF